MQAAGERRPPCRSPAPPPLLRPHRYRVRVGPGLPAQPRGLPGQRLIQVALGRALEEPGHLGQQVGPAAREIAQRGHRGGLLVAGELPPPGTVAGLPRELRYQDPVSLRTIIEHAFEYRTRPPGRHPAGGGESRGYRLPEFILGSPAQLASAAEEQVDGHADERVLRDPLTLSPALAVQRPTQPRQLVQLVGPETQLLALQPLPLGNL